VARFLSEAWFDEVESSHNGAHGAEGSGRATGPEDHLVLEQIVTGTPEGQVSYLVVVAGGRARVERRRAPPGVDGAGGDRTDADRTDADRTDADRAGDQLTITCDWPTATAIAQGHLSTQRALMQGRLRVRGNSSALLGRNNQLANLDPVPPEVRKNTTY
jgi:hypothetical protein